MRTLKYLSPTSIKKFHSDRDEFYLNYLADNRPPRFAQTAPMSVGSAFDAYIKCYLADRFGVAFDDFDTLFDKQVEEHNRVFARTAGAKCFDAYLASGALANLMLEIERYADPGSLAFESTVEGVVSSTLGDTSAFGTSANNSRSLRLLGKPDMHYTCNGVPVVLDWKVNGYCSSSNTSPAKGYVRCLDGWDHQLAKASRSHGRSHRDCQLVGTPPVNVALPLDQINPDWAMQTCIYSWLLGCPVGSSFVIGIDQLACGAVEATPPLIRVATFRSQLSADYQSAVFAQAAECWTASQSPSRVFVGWQGMDAEASLMRCSELDTHHLAFEGEDGDLFAGVL